jgi:spermidine synthase
MDKNTKSVIFFLFILSGLCSLLYQVVWIRLAFAAFGIITPVMSVVLSVYMLGLALGSWLGGKYIERWSEAGRSPLTLYAAAEFFIGTGAFIVPQLFSFSQRLLLNVGESNSVPYLGLSALLIILSMLPWCVAMGTTFPFMMSFVRRADEAASGSFSFLYFANVIGAMAGTLATTVVLVESYGFRHTLWLAGALNFLIAVMAYALQSRRAAAPGTGAMQPAAAARPARPAAPLARTILFVTGFTSMGMEVAWTRAFTPVLGTLVYAFSFLLAGYLLATWVGSSLYRRDLARGRVRPPAQLLMLLAVFSFFPVVFNDPQLVRRIGGHPDIAVFLAMVLCTIIPLCVALGYLTPQLVDGDSGGDPARAGSSYAVNILGCILGPLAVSYLMLPFIGVKFTLIILAVPYVVLFGLRARALALPVRFAGGLAACGILAVAAGWSTSYEVPPIRDRVVKRDYAATVVCYGQGMDKRLLVNGVGITSLCTVTKLMAHLPLAFHKDKPGSALVICFGMGTTYRSLLSWDVNVTAVELVPGVRDLFGYFFDDAERLLKDPRGKVVIDDGRRFLMRTGETFDVVTLDPPPPIEASGSSLLYSKEFYELVKRRLKPGGILQQWFPYDPRQSAQQIDSLRAVARSLAESFPYVRAYPSVGGWGVHFIASLSPVETPAAAELIRRMPENARRDLVEWASGDSADTYISFVLSHEIPMNLFLDGDAQIPVTDDRPFNEYFLLRSLSRSRQRAL